MSNDTIKKHSRSLEKDYAIIPKDLAKDKRLTPFSRLVLIYLLSNSDTWVVRMVYAAHEIGVNPKTFTNAIRELFNLGFIKRDRVRQANGYFSHFDYEVHHQPIFENEKWEAPKKRSGKKNENEATSGDKSLKPLAVEALQPQAAKPLVVKPPVVKRALPMPNKPMPNKPKAMEAMPSHSRNQKAMAPSVTKGRRFKRPQEEEDRFQWLLGLTLLDEHGKVNEDALSFMAHSYSQEKLQRTYFHLVHKLDKKKVQVKKSPLAFYRHLLENEHNCRASHAELNESMAKKFSSELAWGSLEFHEKYVIDRNIPSKDIDFNLEPEVFKDLLSQLYFNVYGNFGT